MDVKLIKKKYNETLRITNGHLPLPIAQPVWTQLSIMSRSPTYSASSDKVGRFVTTTLGKVFMAKEIVVGIRSFVSRHLLEVLDRTVEHRPGLDKCGQYVAIHCNKTMFSMYAFTVIVQCSVCRH